MAEDVFNLLQRHSTILGPPAFLGLTLKAACWTRPMLKTIAQFLVVGEAISEALNKFFVVDVGAMCKYFISVIKRKFLYCS